MSNRFLLLSILVIFVISRCHASDPHESVSKTTPAGIPYYLKSEQFHETFYSTSGLLIFEFSTNLPNITQMHTIPPESLDNINSAKHHSNINLQGKVSSLILDTCKLGDIFQGFYLSEDEKRAFLQRLNSTCFRGKWEWQKLGTLIPSDQYNEDKFWRQNLLDCKSNRVPDSVVAPDELYNSLEYFQETFLQPLNLQLSIPLPDLSAYYKLTIASCTFTENSFIVAIQIPVNANKHGGSSSYQDYSLIPIPMWMSDEPTLVCRLHDRTSATDLENVYHYNFNTGQVISQDKLLCHMTDEPICFLPDPILTQRSMMKNCAQAIIKSEDEDILCDMKCEPFETYDFPIIRKVRSDRYLVVADLSTNQEVSVECPPFQKEETLGFPVTGALEVVLPCDCHIRYGKDIFNSTVPCGAEFSKIPIDFPGIFDNRDESSELLN